MPSVVARFGPVRAALLAAVAIGALVAVGFLSAGSSVRERDRAQHVIALSSGAAPPASATASAGVADSEAAQSFVESRSQVQHPLAAAPDSASMTTAVSPGAPSVAEVKREWRQRSKLLEGVA